MGLLAKRSPQPISPEAFFGKLRWLDGTTPLPNTIEPYRRHIFTKGLYDLDRRNRPRVNFVLCGRGKKNYKSSDLILAALYRLLAWPSPSPTNDCLILASDEDQAKDDLTIAKLLVQANPVLEAEVDVLAKSLRRKDNRGELKILPAGDVAGLHGKTYSFCGYDEIHTYRDWSVFEALSPDPHRWDALQWVTSYASIYNTPGAPLYDLVEIGKRGADKRMLFSWYSGDFCTDRKVAKLVSPEARANPSMKSWGTDGYLQQQKQRLPAGRYRRLHLNLPGSPEGAWLDPENVMACTAGQPVSRPPQEGVRYVGFCDMSGGSSDDAVLAIGHRIHDRRVLDRLISQPGKPPFDPSTAVRRFVTELRRYGLSSVVGDAYGGETFRQMFKTLGIDYIVASKSKSVLYETAEPFINGRTADLLNIPKLAEQLLTLVWRGSKIDHQVGDHDDHANAACGVVAILGVESAAPQIRRLDPLRAHPGAVDLTRRRGISEGDVNWYDSGWSRSADW